MRICLDLTPSIQGHSGIGRYVEELAMALVKLGDREEIRFFYADPLKRQPRPPLGALPYRSICCSNKPWRTSVLMASFLHISMERLIGETDIFHATDFLLPPLKKALSVFTLYDLTFLKKSETHLPLNRIFLTLMVPRFLRTADRVIFISKSTKRDALLHYRIDESKTRMIYPGVNPSFHPVGPETVSFVRRKFNLPERFLLFVGNIEPRKNLALLLEAFNQIRSTGIKLVIAGKKGWLYQEFLEKLETMDLGQDVRVIGFIPDEDLPALYTMAEAFVFPSLYEGFGLPVLEAMACGTPVICSNNSSLPEISGSSAMLVASEDLQGWIDAIMHLLNDPFLRADLSQRGLRQAAQFTWESTARQTLEVYRDLYAHHH